MRTGNAIPDPAEVLVVGESGGFTIVREWLGELLEGQFLALCLVAVVGAVIGDLVRRFLGFSRLSCFLLLRKLIRRLFCRHRALADALNIFDGGVELVDKQCLSKLATEERIKGFYKGQALHWGVIAVGADIQREKATELWDVLITEEQALRIVCIIGPPRAGKSTLAWSAAARLVRERKAIVIRMVYGHKREQWERVPQFYRSIQRPFYILADDLFRHEEVVEVIRGLHSRLPVTILGTSRDSEYKNDGFTCRPYPVALGCATEAEKAETLAKLGMRRTDLSPDESDRLAKAVPFGIMIKELSTGEDDEKGIRRDVEHLKGTDTIAYDAYEYVCFCFQYEIGIPSTVLERLDQKGYFHRVSDRQGVQGFIFRDEAYPNTLRAAHSETAAIAFRSYFHSPHVVLLKVAKAVDPGNDEGRRFLGFLVLRMSRSDPLLIRGGIQQLVPILRSMRQQATSFSELRLWLACLSELKVRQEVDACRDALLSVPPQNAQDCIYLTRLLERKNRGPDALRVMTNCVEQYPSDSRARAALFGVVEHYGTEVEIMAVLEETHAWLTKHAEDGFVRAAFLGSVKRKGSGELKREVLEETRMWLAQAKHRDDSHVRSTFLGFVERNGSREDKRGVFEETRTWLAQHQDDSHVRTAFLGFVERNGSREDRRAVLEETRTWLAQPKDQDDSPVRAAFLGYVERNGPQEVIRTVSEETRAWLAKSEYRADCEVRRALVRLVERRAPEMASQVMAEMSRWLVDHPTNAHVRPALVRLAKKHGLEQQLHELNTSLSNALSRVGRSQGGIATLFDCVIGDKDLEKVFETQLENAIVQHGPQEFIDQWQGDPVKLCSYARYLAKRGHTEEAEDIYRDVLALPLSETTTTIRGKAHYHYGCLLEQLKRWAEAADHFRHCLDIRQDQVPPRLRRAKALCNLGRLAAETGDIAKATTYFVEAEDELLEKALHLAGLQNGQKAPIYNQTGWLYINWKKYEKAIKAFKEANDHYKESDKGYWNNYWGMGEAYWLLGDVKKALSAYEKASKIAPDDWKPPASEEIPERLRQCREALDHGNSASDDSV